MIQTKLEVEATQLSTPPFKNMKKIRSHSSSIYDSCSVIFPDGKVKILTVSWDKTFHVFDLETLKCEKIVKHSNFVFSVYFYKEKQLLMTLDYNGELCFWNLFSSKIKIVKKKKISTLFSYLLKLTRINSSNLFFCCVCGGSSRGSLYSIKIKNIKRIKINEINYPLIDNEKEPLRCIYELKNEKNSILFAGGYNSDYTIKKFNFRTKKHFRFPKKHSNTVLCLISYLNEKNEEIILSGSEDKKILFWTLNGLNIKEIKLNGEINCFLKDFKRNNIFITSYDNGNDYCCLYSLDLKTYEIVENVDKIHSWRINCMKWINKETQNKFITCSGDKTFNIFELQKLKNKNEEKDLNDRINFLRDEEEFFQKYFCSLTNKKMIFSVKLWDSVEIRCIFKVFLV